MTGPVGPAGPAGANGQNGVPGPSGATGRSALRVVLGDNRLRGTARSRVRLALGATHPGRVVISTRRGKKTVATTRVIARQAGTRSLLLPRLAPGSYTVRVQYTATDGQRVNVTARLRVAR